MAKLSKFESAFAAARKGGKSTFSFGGKSYNTKLKDAGPAKSPAGRGAKFAAEMNVPGSARPVGKSLRDAHPPGPKGLSGNPKISLSDRAKQAASVYSKGGVASRNRRDAAAKNNQYADAAAKKMVKGIK